MTVIQLPDRDVMMLDADLPARMHRLRDLGLTTYPDPELDAVADKLADALGTPYAMVDVLGEQHQHFVGLHNPGPSSDLPPVGRTMPLDHGYCPWVMHRRLALVVHDSYASAQFASNPVVDKIGIRFYAGAPHHHPGRDRAGHPLRGRNRRDRAGRQPPQAPCGQGTPRRARGDPSQPRRTAHRIEPLTRFATAHVRRAPDPSMITGETPMSVSDVFLTREHQLLRAEVRSFAEEEFPDRIPHWEKGGAIERALPRTMARKGWIGATIDTAYGGMGAAGHRTKTISIEETSRVSAAMGAALQASQLGVAKIIQFGSEEQKVMWLPLIADGRCLPTIASTGPESGSHIQGITATARREGDEYVLNGRKIHIGNSHIGDLHGVIMRTGPGENGLSAFLVERDRPGLSLPRHTPPTGLRGFSFGELVFNDCRIPAANRLGKEGDGWDVAQSSSVLYGRLNLSAVALGIHQALMDQTFRFVMQRQRYGRPLGHHPVIRQKLGDMLFHLETVRQNVYLGAYMLDTGQSCDAQLLTAKYNAVERGLASARLAAEIHGGAAALSDCPVDRYTRDLAALYAPAGTSDIQRHLMSEAVLQTPDCPIPLQWSERFAVGTDTARRDTRTAT